MTESNPTLAKRVADLERQLSNTKNLANNLLEENKQLIVQNAALAAQAEDLKARIGAFSINIERNEKIGASVKEEIAKLFIDVGENHLRQVRVDAGRAGFIYASQYDFNRIEDDEINTMADEYADSILAGKGGE